MEYEKHKIILPKFDTFDEFMEYVLYDVSVYLFQSGEWDRLEDIHAKELKLKEPPTLEEFMASVRHQLPHGFRIGDKYVDKWGHKIDKK